MTEKRHENLYSLCRICAAVLTDYTYKTCAYAEDINKIFYVDVRDEIEDINPPLFCLKCNATIQNCLKNGSKVASPPPPPPPPRVTNVDDIMALDTKSPIPPDIERALSHIIDIKVKQSKNNTIQIKSGGPKPLTLATVTEARKQSQDVTKRTVRKRSRQTKEYLRMISGEAVKLFPHKPHISCIVWMLFTGKRFSGTSSTLLQFL